MDAAAQEKKAPVYEVLEEDDEFEVRPLAQSSPCPRDTHRRRPPPPKMQGAFEAWTLRG